MKKTLIFIIFSTIITLTLGACSVFPNGEDDPNNIQGSGHIAARTVSVSPELGGKVVDVLVKESDIIQEGDELIQFEDDIYQAQYNQASAAVAVAESAVETQKDQLEAAKIQYELAKQGARFQEEPQRNAVWFVSQPDDFILPAWYYEKSEQISSAQAELDAAQAKLETELKNLENELENASNADLIAAEKRLAEARTTYVITDQTLTEVQNAQDQETLEEVANEEVDAALTELEAAQLNYDQMLSSDAYDDIIDARARVAVAQTRRDNAQDYLDQLQTGEDSLQIEAAQAAVKQAESGIAQAEANLDQAKAALETLKVQLSKTTVYSPISGVVMERNVEAGEVVGAGSTSLIIGELDNVELTVYIPEDRYGKVQLGQEASVTVDSFPEETFEGSVVRIADEAEFTPRNVQTVDGRKSTVYAILIRIANPDWKLKPGMPADAVIDVNN